MRKELPHFHIEDCLGGNQDWFRDLVMRVGGCAAVTACDLCIVMTLNGYSDSLIPFDRQDLTREHYLEFGKIMKPYLHPRLSGITKLATYTEGLSSYLRSNTDMGDHLHMESIPGSTTQEEAQECVRRQIDRGLPVVYLLLKHADPRFEEYEWHWFLLNGYDDSGDSFQVQAVTYGEAEWMDFPSLWDTGKDLRGGMVLVHR